MRRVFTDRKAEGKGSPATSAVLAPIVSRPDGLHLLFTRRTATLSQHAGEISFPGGRIERRESPLNAALRETEEEIGVTRQSIDVFGHLVDFTTFRDSVVSCWVGLLDAKRLRLPPGRTPEVEEVYLVPIERLRNPLAATPARSGELVHDPLHVFLQDVRGYELREWDGPDQPERRIHYWRLTNGTTLWGITAHLTAIFLERAYGWRPPSPAKIISQMDDVFP